MTSTTVKQRGFSLLEVLVGVLILAVVATIAIPAIRRATRVSALRRAADQAAQTIALRRSKTTGNTPMSYNASTEAAGGVAWIAVNPATVAPPTGAHTGTLFDFRGGTGELSVDGTPQTGAIVLADSTNLATAYAVVVGRTASTRLYARSGSTWEELR